MGTFYRTVKRGWCDDIILKIGFFRTLNHTERI